MFGIGLGVTQCAALDSLQRGNLLADSWQFSAAYWGGAPAAFSAVAGQPDPWGGTKATAMVATGAGSNWSQRAGQSAVYVTEPRICLSAFFKSAAVFNSYGSVRIYNATDAAIFQQVYTVFGDLTFGLAANTADGGGIADVGSGWYRIWAWLDLEARGLHAKNLQARFELFNGAAAVGQTRWMAGAMMNEGTAPAGYQERP
jgi:hypothetical protein